MREVMAIAFCGALGAVSRYGLSAWTHQLLGARFAFGTLFVNVLGSFLLGAAMTLGLSTEVFPPVWRVPITVGFLGALTTFSTFSYETFRYLEDGAHLLVGVNIVGNVVACLLAVWGGVTIARWAAAGW